MSPLQALQGHQEIYWNHLNQPRISHAGCTLIQTGLATPWFNSVIAAHEHCSVQDAVAYFKSQSLPFSWWVELGTPAQEHEAEIAKQGMIHAGDFEGMVLELKNLKKISSPLEIEIVSTQECMEQYLNVVIASYEDDKSLLDPVRKLISQAKAAPAIIHFLGKVSGKPVTAGSVFIQDRNAGIYHVGTVPEERKKGFARVLMNAMLEQASVLGCTHSYLTSTPMGNHLYKTLGYRCEAMFRFFIHV